MFHDLLSEHITSVSIRMFLSVEFWKRYGIQIYNSVMELSDAVFLFVPLNGTPIVDVNQT